MIEPLARVIANIELNTCGFERNVCFWHSSVSWDSEFLSSVQKGSMFAFGNLSRSAKEVGLTPGDNSLEQDGAL